MYSPFQVTINSFTYLNTGIWCWAWSYLLSAICNIHHKVLANSESDRWHLWWSELSLYMPSHGNVLWIPFCWWTSTTQGESQDGGAIVSAVHCDFDFDKCVHFLLKSMMHIWKTIRSSKYFSFTLLDILDL